MGGHRGEGREEEEKRCGAGGGILWRNAAELADSWAEVSEWRRTERKSWVCLNSYGLTEARQEIEGHGLMQKTRVHFSMLR